MVVQDAPRWETLLLHKQAVLEVCCEVRDFSFMRARRDLFAKAPYNVNLSYLGTASKDELYAANSKEESAMEDEPADTQDLDKKVVVDTKEVTDMIEKITAEQKEETQNDKARIEKIKASFDKSLNEQVAEIKKLPEPQRPNAAEKVEKTRGFWDDLFLKFQEAMGRMVAWVITEAIAVYESVKGWIVNTYNTVKDACVSTFNAVTDFMGDTFGIRISF